MAARSQAVTFKVDLPNYGVFDEKRVFAPGPMPGPLKVRGVRIGVPICEDIWGPDPVECLSETGARSCWCPTARPSRPARKIVRLNLAVARVVEAGLPLIYLNQVGGQDELVFDGASFVLNADRRARAAVAGLGGSGRDHRVDARRDGKWVCAPGTIAAPRRSNAAVYHAMVLGLRDYVNKNRFPGVVLGLSGGIDSALSAAVAVDALGAERVRCVMLPSRYTRADSLEDAEPVREAAGRAATRPSRSSAPVEAFGEALADAVRRQEAPTPRKRTSSRASAA